MFLNCTEEVEFLTLQHITIHLQPDMCSWLRYETVKNGWIPWIADFMDGEGWEEHDEEERKK